MSRTNAPNRPALSELPRLRDRLEGHITTDLWARKTAEWEREREDIDRQLAALGTAKTNYLASGMKLLELAQRAYDLYVAQPPHEQRRLLDVVVSNCRLNGGTIEDDFRKSFDLQAEATESNVDLAESKGFETMSGWR